VITLNAHLSKPVDESEIEYAPNIIGRFSPSTKLKLARYGSKKNRGIPRTEFAVAQSVWGGDIDTDQQLTIAYNIIAKEYEAYFHG